ncbi:hypothetical protein HMPREF9374_1269 [Desmospora sp. 8437]|nr:hypothetical protein HMPREF9374_1269 [Desmospora sp. 8437]
MLNPDIEKIFDRIPVGALVRVQGPILGREHWKLKRLVRGDRGSLIMLVQNRLRAAGYYRRECDGIWERSGAGGEKVSKRASPRSLRTNPNGT